MSRFEFTGTGRNGTVKVDGHDISSGVRGLTVDLGVDRPPSVLLDLVVVDATDVIADDVPVTVPDDTRDALVKLGWTPPQEQ